MKISNNSGPVSIIGGTISRLKIVTNDIFEECTLFCYPGENNPNPIACKIFDMHVY